jgi:hypothetical protein
LFAPMRQAIGYFICISKRQLILWSKYVCTKPSFLRGWQYVGCCQRCHRSPHGTMRVPWKQQQIPVRHTYGAWSKEILTYTMFIDAFIFQHTKPLPYGCWL